MPKQMRYQWFQNVPRHVTRQEYRRLQGLSFCSLILGVSTVAMAFATVSGLTLQSSRQLAQIEAISIAAATDHTGELLAPVKLQGFLVTEDAPTMPDQPDLRVIRGVLQLTAKLETETDEPVVETLWAWEDSAETVFLSDGTEQIPLGFDLAVLPMTAQDIDESARVVRQGESARTKRPVAVEYGGQTLPLPEADIDSIITEVERQVLPHGQEVVVVAGLESGPQGSQLVDPLGNRLKVLIGSEAEIRRQGQRLRMLYGLLVVPMGVACWAVTGSARRLRQEFVERSNQ